MYFNLPCVNFIRCPRAFRRMLTSADLLRKGMDEKENDLDDFIDGTSFVINTNVSSISKFSSFFIIFGRQPRLPFNVGKFAHQAERRMLCKST